MFAGGGREVRQPGFSRQRCSRRVQLALPQRVEQIALQDDAQRLPAAEALVSQVLGTRCHGLSNLAAEAAHGERHRLPLDQAVIEPRRARRRHLTGKVEVGAVGQHQRWPLIAVASEASHLDDAADRRGVLERPNIAEADMVGAAVRAVDDGVGLACQLVMQPLAHKAPDDR